MAATVGLALLLMAGCQRVDSRPSPYPPYPLAPPAPGQAPASRLALPAPDTDAGVLVRMLLAECKGPGYPDYDEREAVAAMQAMKAVVHNRLFTAPARFGAPGARLYADVICAPGQWAGFDRDPRGRYRIDPTVLTRVDDILRRANGGPPGPYHRFVRAALAVTYGPVVDPFANLRFTGGVAVRGGAYGFRRAGASHPGGAFVPIDPVQGGVLAGTQFYALPSAGAP